MKLSTDRVLTTHVGSLPRPAELEALLLGREMGTLEAEGRERLPALVATSVADVVKRQADAGIDIVSDGEMSKYAYSTYARERMTGLVGTDQVMALSELAEFPNFAKRIELKIKTPACVGPIAYRGEDALATDIATLKAAASNSGLAAA